MTQKKEIKKVGAFTLYDDGTFTAPAQYMLERGDERLARIERGEDELFNHTAYLSPDPATAVLVWLQTDYAGWLGDALILAPFRQREIKQMTQTH